MIFCKTKLRCIGNTAIDAMGVATKKRRKIIVNGRKFVWHVVDKLPGYKVQVISEDKRFLVEYNPLNFDPYCVIEVIGKEFPGVPHAGHIRERFHCPQFGDGDSATPGLVRRLIEWCLYADRKLIPVDMLGKPILPLSAEGGELIKRQKRLYEEMMAEIKKRKKEK